MTSSRGRVAEPFAGDPLFWASVRASADALVTLVAATLLTLLLGRWWALAFVVPVLLLVRAATAGQVSARRSRTAFETTDRWREAERRAVAGAFLPALLRRPH